MPVCRECAHCWEDRRETVYRRGECWFCRLKRRPGSIPTSRGARISPKKK